MSSDKITIGLYSLQTDKSPGFNDRFLGEVANIKAMKERFTHEANVAGRRPPIFVISMLLIPPHGDYNRSTNPGYEENQSKMLESMRSALDKEGLSDIKLESFYEKPISAEERSYLQGLSARGSCADMIKTHAIISEDNSNRRHLQIDSNTQIHDYRGFYNATFASESAQDKIAGASLNASYYDEHYVSAHNKVVYTVPNSRLAVALRETHLQYCDAHKDDSPSSKEKTEKNSVYSKDFTVGLSEVGLTRRLVIPGDEGERVIYPADMRRPEYDLSRYVVTAVNKSWDIKSKPKPPTEKMLEQIRIPIGDTLCDFASFGIAVKKHTGELYEHYYASGWDETRAEHAENMAREELMHLSNLALDKAIIARFYDEVRNSNISAAPIDGVQVTKEMMLQELANHFPDDMRGNELVRGLFGCSVRELQTDPMRPSLGAYNDFEEARSREKHQELTNIMRRVEQKSQMRLTSVDSHYLHVQQAAIAHEMRTASYKTVIAKQRNLKDNITTIRRNADISKPDYTTMNTHDLEVLRDHYKEKASSPGITSTKKKEFSLEFQHIRAELSNRGDRKPGFGHF